MKVKYIRWSTLQQTPDRQLLSTDGYDLVIKEQCSGSIPFAKRIEGAKLLDLIKSGKITDLHIEEFSRIGRNALDCLTTLQTCAEHNVNVFVMNMQVNSMIDGKQNPLFKLFSHVISIISEQEREAIKERTEAGKQAARMKGVKFGRKVGSNESDKDFLSKEDNKKIAKLLRQEIHSIRQISAITGTSNTTVQKVKKLISK